MRRIFVMAEVKPIPDAGGETEVVSVRAIGVSDLPAETVQALIDDVLAVAVADCGMRGDITAPLEGWDGLSDVVTVPVNVDTNE